MSTQQICEREFEHCTLELRCIQQRIAEIVADVRGVIPASLIQRRTELVQLLSGYPTPCHTIHCRHYDLQHGVSHDR